MVGVMKLQKHVEIVVTARQTQTLPDAWVLWDKGELPSQAELPSQGTWLTWKEGQALPDVEETAWVHHAKLV